MHSREILVVLLTIGASVGCTQGSTIVATPAPTVTPQQTVDSTIVAPLTSTNPYSPGSRIYDYHLTSTVQVIVGDSLPRIDTTNVAAVLTATFSGIQPVVAMIKADSLRVVSGLASVNSGGIQTQFTSSMIDLQTGRITIQTSTSPMECTVSTIDPTFRGDELLPVFPEARVNQASWEDITTYQICRGGVPIQVKRKTQYRALNGATLGRQDLVRTINLELSGTGTQWQQPVRVTGRGVGTDTITITSTSTSTSNPSRIESITGRSQLTVEFSSPIRHQTFTQVSMLTIKARSR